MSAKPTGPKQRIFDKAEKRELLRAFNLWLFHIRGDVIPGCTHCSIFYGYDLADDERNDDLLSLSTVFTFIKTQGLDKAI